MILVATPLVIAGSFVAWQAGTDDPLPSSGPAAGPIQEIAPEDRSDPLKLSGPVLGEEGESALEVDVADYRGSVLVVNVWGAWCAPCRAEAPVLQGNATLYADEGVRFLGVNVKDTPSAARAFERRYGITYPSIDDSVQRQAFLQLSGEVPAAAIPSTLVLDRQGRVAARVIGQIGDATLRALLDAVLAEDHPGDV